MSSRVSADGACLAPAEAVAASFRLDQANMEPDKRPLIDSCTLSRAPFSGSMLVWGSVIPGSGLLSLFLSSKKEAAAIPDQRVETMMGWGRIEGRSFRNYSSCGPHHTKIGAAPSHPNLCLHTVTKNRMHPVHAATSWPTWSQTS